jgi:hypothetical protein
MDQTEPQGAWTTVAKVAIAPLAGLFREVMRPWSQASSSALEVDDQRRVIGGHAGVG